MEVTPSFAEQLYSAVRIFYKLYSFARPTVTGCSTLKVNNTKGTIAAATTTTRQVTRLSLSLPPKTLKMPDLTQTPAWKALEAHYATTMKDAKMKDLFAADLDRFNKMHLEFEDILFDYSKNIITDETMSLLYALADQQDVSGLAKKMYSGEKISEYHLLLS